jgi:hypothetical protein
MTIIIEAEKHGLSCNCDTKFTRFVPAGPPPCGKGASSLVASTFDGQQAALASSNENFVSGLLCTCLCSQQGDAGNFPSRAQLVRWMRLCV